MPRRGSRQIGTGVGNGRFGHPGDRNDIAGAGFFHRHAFQPAERQQFRGAPGFDHLAIIIQRVDRRVDLDRARLDLAGQDTAEEVVAIEQRDKELERPIDIGGGRGHMLDNLGKQRGQRAFAHIRVFVGIAIAA